MKFGKTLARAATLVLLVAPIPVAAAAGPASAATPVTTTTTTTIYNQTVMIYGQGDALIEGAVTASDGSYVTGGSVALQASAYPFKTWTTIYTTSPSKYLSHLVQPKISTAYRWVYSGFTNADPTDTTTASYAASQTSTPMLQQVARRLTVRSVGLHLMGKIAPAAKLKVVFKKKVHGKYRPWFTTRTNKKGKFDVHLHAARGTKAAIVIAAKGGYASAVQMGSIV